MPAPELPASWPLPQRGGGRLTGYSSSGRPRQGRRGEEPAHWRRALTGGPAGAPAKAGPCGQKQTAPEWRRRRPKRSGQPGGGWAEGVPPFASGQAGPPLQPAPQALAHTAASSVPGRGVHRGAACTGGGPGVSWLARWLKWAGGWAQSERAGAHGSAGGLPLRDEGLPGSECRPSRPIRGPGARLANPPGESPSPPEGAFLQPPAGPRRPLRPGPAEEEGPAPARAEAQLGGTAR